MNEEETSVKIESGWMLPKDILSVCLGWSVARAQTQALAWPGPRPAQVWVQAARTGTRQADEPARSPPDFWQPYTPYTSIAGLYNMMHT